MTAGCVTRFISAAGRYDDAARIAYEARRRGDFATARVWQHWSDILGAHRKRLARVVCSNPPIGGR